MRACKAIATNRRRACRKSSPSAFNLRAPQPRTAAPLAKGDLPELPGLVFHCIYTLRNPLMHGGVSWNSQLNRAQRQDCVNLRGKLVPVVIDLMMANPETLWGAACYPVVN